MRAFRYRRILGAAFALTVLFGTGVASADEADGNGDDAQAVEQTDDEPAADVEQADDESAEVEDDTELAGEVDDAEDGTGDEAPPEEVAEADTTQQEEWETPLRNRVTPVMNQEGSLGFHRIASALSPGPMQFQTGLFGRATSGSSFVRYNDQHGAFTGSVLVNASFHEYFGAHFQTQARNTVNTLGRPQAMLAHGDMILGGSGAYPVYDGISLGGDLNLYVPSQFGGVGFSLRSMSVRPRLLASFDFDEIAGRQDDLYVPVIAHLNVGYRFDNTENLVGSNGTLDRIERTAYDISAYDMVELGVGMEFPLPYVTPFLGWTLDIPVNPPREVCQEDRPLACVPDIGAASYPQRLSVGAKAEPVDRLGLHLGMDIGVTGAQAEGLPVTLPYEFHFGISWNIDPGYEAETRLGHQEQERSVGGRLEGRVIDHESGEPIEDARVSYLDGEFSPQLSGAETGVFRSYQLEPGEDVVFRVEHADYKTEEVSWQVEEGLTQLEIELEPRLPQVVVSGRIVDEGGEALEMVEVGISSQEGEVLELQTDEEGRFEQEIEAQTATIAAIHGGYLAGGAFVEADDGEQHDIEVTLRETEERLAVIDDGAIELQGQVEFQPGEPTLREESDELLDHLAALLLENGDVGTLEVHGHTDDDGDEEELFELSQQRADAVRDALVERGVAPGRIVAEGFGSTQPMVPNTSSRNRAMNRRIEFELTE